MHLLVNVNNEQSSVNNEQSFVNNEQSSVNNEQSSNNFLNMLFLNKLSLLTLSGYALTAFLFFGIGTYIDFSDDSLSGFNSTILEKDLLLFRSSFIGNFRAASYGIIRGYACCEITESNW